MSNIKKRSEGGFTIIEVLIVLAIAGLIMLIVFLAVPALQRNSRNTQRKNDVSATLAAVSEYLSNNAGSLPTGYSAGAITGSGTAPSSVKLGYYSTVTFATGAQTALATTSDTVRVVTGAVCGASGATVTANASARSVAAQYLLETGSGLVAQCQES